MDEESVILLNLPSNALIHLFVCIHFLSDAFTNGIFSQSNIDRLIIRIYKNLHSEKDAAEQEICFINWACGTRYPHQTGVLTTK